MPTLDWIGRSAVVEHHKQVPFRMPRGKDFETIRQLIKQD